MTRGQGRKPRNQQQMAEYVQEKIELICKAIKSGLTINNAARAAGVNPNTYYVWKKKGEAGIEPWASYWERVQLAIHQGEAVLANRIATASQDDWRAAAWMLERRHPENWSKQTEVNLKGQLNMNLSEMSDEQLKEELDKAKKKLEEAKRGETD